MEILNKDNFDVLLTHEQIEKRLVEMAHEIDHDYKDEDVILLSILKGAVVFTVDLMMKLNTPAKIDFMKVSSYEGTKSTGVLNVRQDLKEDITNKNVLICEDIIDTGYTLSYLRDYLLDRNPKSLKIAVFADKKDCRKVEVPVDYTGFKIPDKFVIGYGLDYNEFGRDLNYLGYVKDPSKPILIKK